MARENSGLPCAEGETYTLEISDLNHRGEGVGKIAGFTLFVPGALPGDVVEASISAVHKNYADAALLARKDSSPHRVNPPCPYHDRCGGCQLQHLAYKQQVGWKHKMVAETLSRIAGIETAVLPTVGMKDPWRYRNKARVHLGLESGRVNAGFYETKSNRIINIEDCLVQHPVNTEMINTVRRALQKYFDTGSKPETQIIPLSEFTVRTSFASSECLITLTGPDPGPKKTDSGLKKLGALISKEAGKEPSGIVLELTGQKGIRSFTLSGQPHIEEIIGGHRYRISPRSFFQVNSPQAGALYELAASMAGAPRTAFDLYCGTGNFSLYLSPQAEKVIGVDSSRTSITDARTNARTNNIGNVEFIKARVERDPSLLLRGEHPKTIFLNPPRGGCSAALLDAVVKAYPNRVVYISCNPATLARDLKRLLHNNFSIRTVQPVDMFPHTSHVETVVSLVRK